MQCFFKAIYPTHPTSQRYALIRKKKKKTCLGKVYSVGPRVSRVPAAAMGIMQAPRP